MRIKAAQKFSKFKVALGHAVAMVTCCVKEMITMCPSIIRQFFDTMIVASSDKSGYNQRKKLQSRTERDSREIFHSFIGQSKIFSSSPNEIRLMYTNKKPKE